MRLAQHFLIAFAALSLTAAPARKTLDFAFVDTEGGQATLIVTPAGESLLIDAGFPANGGRDAGRIIAAAQRLGLDHIDYVMITHFHLDHAGGVPDLMEKFPVKTVIDHGDNTETTKSAQDLTARYESVIKAQNAKRIHVKPGDKIPLKGADVTVLVARGEKLSKTFKGSGPNQFCAEPQAAPDPTENARSVGVLVQFGDFRFIDLGDLTTNKEIDLMCPTNPIGRVDLYLTTHHGTDTSGAKAVVHALAPRVAIMNNGFRKGGSVKAWQIVAASPGLQDLWQLHTSSAGGTDNNVADDRIANLDEKCEGKWLEVSASKNREFTVTNSRNGFKKTYKP